MWQIISQFWNSITEASSGTIEFFQSIGNAVAGAVGSFFAEIIHLVFDFILLFRYIFEVVKHLFWIILEPLSFILNFIFVFITSLFADIEYQPTIGFIPEVKQLLEMVPQWAIFSQVFGAAFFVLIGFACLRVLTSE